MYIYKYQMPFLSQTLYYCIVLSGSNQGNLIKFEWKLVRGKLKQKATSMCRFSSVKPALPVSCWPGTPMEQGRQSASEQKRLAIGKADADWFIHALEPPSHSF